MIDSHTHFFPENVARNPAHWAAERGEKYWAELVGERPDGKPSLQGFPSAQKFVRDMDEAGVDRAVIQGWYWQNQQTCRELNAQIAEVIGANPRRLSAFAALQPNSADALEIAESARANGFCGIGELHDGVQKFSFGGEIFEKIMEIAARDNLAVSLHITEKTDRQYLGKTETDTLGAIAAARNHPDVNFIFAHWCGNLAFENPEFFDGLENVFFDSAATQFTAPKTAFADAEKSPLLRARAVYGTDYPLRLYPRKCRLEEMANAAEFARGQIGAGFAKNLFTNNFLRAIKVP